MTFEFRNWDEEDGIHVLLDFSYSSCKNNIKQKPIQKNFQRSLAKIGHYEEIGMKGSISKIYWRVMQILCALFLVAYYQVVQFLNLWKWSLYIHGKSFEIFDKPRNIFSSNIIYIMQYLIFKSGQYEINYI